PLRIATPKLAILGQICLLRWKRKGESFSSVFVSLWTGVLSSLIRLIQHPPPAEAELGTYEDLNVEHAQVLVFLFHFLPLMRKKSVLLSCARTLIDA
ncbi:unnamed protein product, partial [Cyprideis torosa]